MRVLSVNKIKYKNRQQYTWLDQLYRLVYVKSVVIVQASYLLIHVLEPTVLYLDKRDIQCNYVYYRYIGHVNILTFIEFKWIMRNKYLFYFKVFAF